MIKVEKPTEQILEDLGVFKWPIWKKEASEFPWEYDMEEICYILSGEAVISPEKGDVVRIVAGDLVTFSSSLKCHWKITSPIEKRYSFR